MCTSHEEERTVALAACYLGKQQWKPVCRKLQKETKWDERKRQMSVRKSNRMLLKPSCVKHTSLEVLSAEIGHR